MLQDYNNNNNLKNIYYIIVKNVLSTNKSY